MKSRPTALLSSLVVSIGAASASPAVPVAQPAKSISWSEIKQAIAETICFPVVNGRALDHFMFSERSMCGPAAAPNSLASLVDGAIADSWPSLVSIQGYELDFDSKCRAIPAGSRETRDAAARKILLDDPSFTGPIVSRVVDALGARGETCPDCPQRAKVPSRSVALKDVMPYALAFISVDPVHTVDSDGKRLEQPKLSFHICTGLNTVTALPRDEILARAGYVAARATNREAVGDIFMNALGDDAFGALKDDAARTDYVRKRMAEQLRAGPEVKAAICSVASTLGRDLALVLTDCPTN
jgi:hypothetical protein